MNTKTALDEIVKRAVEKIRPILRSDITTYIRQACLDYSEGALHYIRHLESCVENMPRGMGDLTRELREQQETIAELRLMRRKLEEAEQDKNILTWLDQNFIEIKLGGGYPPITADSNLRQALRRRAVNEN